MVPGGIFGALLLLILLYGLAIFGVGVIAVALIFFVRRSNRIGVTLLLVGSLLIAPILAVIHEEYKGKRMKHRIEATIPLELGTFLIHPKALRDESAGYGRQEIWGEIDLNVKLPQGGVIRGASDRISLLESNGKFHSLVVFYQPDMTFYRASSVDDVFDYWKKQGKVVSDGARSIRIDCGAYIVDIDEIAGYVTLIATVDKDK